MPPRCTIVAGPPCSGKSTYVAKHAGPAALIVCWDTIARELGSPVNHGHPTRLWHATEKAYRRRLDQVRDAEEAWIIRTLTYPAERRAWVKRFDAELVVLCPPRDVLLERARQRGNSAKTVALIQQWFAANPVSRTAW